MFRQPAAMRFKLRTDLGTRRVLGGQEITLAHPPCVTVLEPARYGVAQIPRRAERGVATAPGRSRTSPSNAKAYQHHQGWVEGRKPPESPYSRCRPAAKILP
jgi:hypothetical protein